MISLPVQMLLITAIYRKRKAGAQQNFKNLLIFNVCKSKKSVLLIIFPEKQIPLDIEKGQNKPINQ